MLLVGILGVLRARGGEADARRRERSVACRLRVTSSHRIAWHATMHLR